MTDEIRRLKHKRWGSAMITMAADIAKEKGVVVRLEMDGAITVMPHVVGTAEDEDDEDNGLEKW
jgi:hypothetical protein